MLVECRCLLDLEIFGEKQLEISINNDEEQFMQLKRYKSLEFAQARLFTPIWLLSCAFLAFVLRALPYHNFLGTAGELLFYGPDSYDHLRRISLGMATFPKIPVFDSYYGYPVGTGQIWAPLFDYLITILTLAVGLGKGDEQTARFLGFWLPPVLSSFTVFMVYAVGKRLFGKTAGLVAALIIALLPGHILYSFVSELDHHVAEPMVSLAIFSSLLKEVQIQERGSKKIFFPMTGLWMAIGILIWRGSLIFWGIALLSLAVHIFFGARSRENSKKVAYYAMKVCLLSAALLAPACIFDVWQAAGVVSFNIVSWFHIIFLLVFALLYYLLSLISNRRNISIPVVFGFFPLVSILVFILPAGRKFIVEFVSGLAVIGGRDPWLDSISELRPILFPNGKLDLLHATETLSIIYWLFPVLLITRFRNWKKDNSSSFGCCLFLVWGATFWLLPLFRERYVHLTAIVIAIGGGLIFSTISEYASKRGKAAAGTILLILLFPSVPFLARIPEVGLPSYERYDLQAAMKWLRERTPKTSYFENPVQAPEYGVISDWGVGALINYVAQRPTVATNFGWETHGLFESAAFLTLSDPNLAERILLDNNVRYIFLSELNQNLPRLKEIVEFGLKKGKLKLALFPSAPPYMTMYHRLYVRDGSSYEAPDIKVEGLCNYRLIYESPNGFTNPEIGFLSYYKIFEYIPGAIVQGETAPGQDVAIRLKLRSNTGRMFIYTNTSLSNSDGVFQIQVPYSTDSESGDVTPVGKYEISINGNTFSIDVKEENVLSRKTVRCCNR